jgi:glutamate-5-semialdehyde dehydrogenase
MDYKSELLILGKRAKQAARDLAIASTEAKNECLSAIVDQLSSQQDLIIRENEVDLENGMKNKLSGAMLDRLKLTPERINAMITALKEVMALEDPVGGTEEQFTLPNKLVVMKVRVPIGVIGIVYESRPNVTVDAAGLCLKAGNAVILRGGSESINSNKALAAAMRVGLNNAGMNDAAVQLLPWTDRQAVAALLRLNGYIDLIIPRGGEGLIGYVAENATVPVIKHYKGVCNIYVDKSADEQMALSIIENAKCQRPGVCNAVETVLIHEEIAASFAPQLANLLEQRNVELRGDDFFCQLVPTANGASEDDWYEEYLDLILAVKVVPDITAAVDHIGKYGSDHSDAIIAEDSRACEKFLREVDSAVVYVNASTRFTDGGQFGMGAEIGISTDRLHARGPMGLKELTTYKYNVIGSGQIRE